MMEETRMFKKGDFITYNNKPGSFSIFEGIDLSTSSYKRFSVIVDYDPNKYRKHDDGEYKSSPFFEVATKTTRCDKTVDEGYETYWVRVCTDAEKERAIDIMQQYGYYWNEDLLAVINKETGEIIRKVVNPKLEYHGEIIRPITKRLKKLLRIFCVENNKKKYSATTYYYNPYYSYYDEYYDY